MKTHLSIRGVSDSLQGSRYNRSMTKTWRNWGPRYRLSIKDKELTLGKIAEKVGVAQSTVRSWTNGTRPIGLDDFVAICDAAGLDPLMILAYEGDAELLHIVNIWRMTTGEGRELLRIAAIGAEQRVQQNKAKGRKNPSSNGA